MKLTAYLLAAIVCYSGVSYAQSTGTTETAAPSASQVRPIENGTKRSGQLPASSDPTFDSGTDDRLKEAIKIYTDIAARGGWRTLPKEAKFTIGIEGPQDNLLRERLIISDDLPPALKSGAFDADLSGALKHFQKRHGLTETGNVGPATLAALNLTVEQRIKQLEASLLRTTTIGFNFGTRFVAVNIPAAFVETVENDKVVRRYRVVVGKTESRLRPLRLRSPISI
jgi:L,D-transpeptidase YcbB